MKKNFLKNSKFLFLLSTIGSGDLALLSTRNSLPSISIRPTKNQFSITWNTVLGFLAFVMMSHSLNAQSCEAPTNVQTEYENGKPTVQISWDGATPENGWIILYGMEGTIDINQFLSDPQNYENPEARIEYVSTSPNYIYANMLQPARYEFYVVADCGVNGMEASDMADFMMEGRGEEQVDSGCETPYSMNVSESGETAVDVSWAPQDGELYHIAWGPEGLEMNPDFFNDPQTGSIITSENPYHLIFTGPERFQPHSLFMRKFCGDIQFSEWTEPTCIAPSALVSSQDLEDITLSWTPGDYESGWQIAYGPEGFDVNDESNPDVTRVNTNGTPSYTLSVYDVELGITYDFYVRSRCSEQNLSDWTGPGTFIPEIAPCFAVTNMEARHLTYKTADIYWTPVGGESNWTVTYGISPLDPNNSLTVSVQGSPKTTLKDLEANTTYDFYVTSICVAGQTADGETISFSTTQGSTGGYCTPIFTNGCEYGVVIDHFILTGENDTEIYDLNTGCSDSNYDDRTDESVDLAPGSDYLAWVTSTSLSGDHCVIWIDLNNNGVFEETERVAAKSMDSPAEIVQISIPESASVGERRMRVLVGFAAYFEDLTPCNDIGDSNGEVHDYTVNILQLDDCNDAIAGMPMDNFAICPDETFTISVTGASAPAKGLDRTWQSSPAGQNNWSDIAGSDLPSLTLYGGIGQAMDFRYKVSCSISGETDTSNLLQVFMSTNCYCKPIGSLCNGPSGLQINNVYLAGETVILDNDTNGGGSCYEDFTLKFAPDLKQGETYNLSVWAKNAALNQDKMIAWIDFNNNKIFDQNEVVLDFTNGLPTHIVTSDFTVPENVPPGEYRMRLRIGWSYATLLPCNGIGWGETEDYTIRVIEGDQNNCSGTPDAGVASVEPEEGNPNSSYTVTAVDYDVANGLTYQWQSNTDGAGWVNEGGLEDQYSAFAATAPNQEGIEVAWRLEVTCTFSQETTYSETAIFTTTITTGGYCIPELDCTDGDVITNVTFQEIDNTTACSSNGYGNYTAISATVQSGGTYPISVTVGDGWAYESVSVWIDFDNSQTFDEDEFFYIGTGSDEALTGDISIPASASNGSYRMRVRVAAVGEGSATWDMACDEEQGYGETEDYTVIVDGVVGIADNGMYNFTYYPNPVNKVLYIEAGESIKSIAAYNLLGQLVLSDKSVVDGKVDVSSLSTGTFIFRVTFNNGQIENLKVVKE